MHIFSALGCKPVSYDNRKSNEPQYMCWFGGQLFKHLMLEMLVLTTDISQRNKRTGNDRLVITQMALFKGLITFRKVENTIRSFLSYIKQLYIQYILHSTNYYKKASAN